MFSITFVYRSDITRSFRSTRFDMLVHCQHLYNSWKFRIPFFCIRTAIICMCATFLKAHTAIYATYLSTAFPNYFRNEMKLMNIKQCYFVMRSNVHLSILNFDSIPISSYFRTFERN